jgi:hypothetical protein
VPKTQNDYKITGFFEMCKEFATNYFSMATFAPMANPKELYRQFCTQAPPDFPVFMQDWYLDAVCDGGTWDAVIYQQQDKTVGVWPFFLKKKAIWTYIAMPLMGKLMGPYIVPEQREISAEMHILEQMAQLLPTGLAAFEQDFNYTIANWLPLYWRGFSQTTRYSYQIPLQPATTAELWENVAPNYKRKIKKARNLVDITVHLPATQLYDLCAQSFTRQRLAFPLTPTYFSQIYEAFVQRNAGQAFYAVDKNDGAVHSAIFLVWDQQSAYLLWGGDDPAFRKSGSGILLQWHAIEYAQNTLHLPIFDFEGSMIKSVEQSRRYLGGAQRAYFRVRKEWSPLWKWGKFLFR